MSGWLDRLEQKRVNRELEGQLYYIGKTIGVLQTKYPNDFPKIMQHYDIVDPDFRAGMEALGWAMRRDPNLRVQVASGLNPKKYAKWLVDHYC